MLIDTMSSQKIDTRTRILKAAWSLLEDQTTALPRMSDIAKETGISRQALYLHFPSRLELLVATTRYQDQVFEIDKRLAPSRNARGGIERLDAFIDAWCSYIPKIYGVARALLAVEATDPEAGAAWAERMADVREGCTAAVRALERDGILPDGVDVEVATDLLWTLISVRNWEHLTQTCEWPQDCYLDTVKSLAHAALAQDPAALIRSLKDCSLDGRPTPS